MFNVDNHGLVQGRLTDEIRYFTNSDGSRRLMLTVATQDAFRGRNGYKSAQFIPLTAFIPAGRTNGIYAHMHKGDKISASYSVRNNNYRTKEGTMVYGLELAIESVKLQEPKSITTTRHSALAAEAAS